MNFRNLSFRMLIISAVVVFLGTLTPGCASTNEKKPACDPRKTYCPNSGALLEPEAAPPEDASAELGVEIVRLRVTAAGHLLDLRYRVLDKEKASPIFDRNNKAYLVDEASGTRLSVPRTAKVGPLRQTNFNPDPERVYFILFANAGGAVKSGSRVTLETGEYKIRNLAVQ